MNLTDELAAQLDAVTPPRPDLGRVVQRARSRQRRRRLAGSGAAVALVGLVAAGIGTGWVPELLPESTDELVATEPMDFGQGLRAFASPDGPVSMGGRTFSAGELEALDTDAAATAYGVVYYRDGRPHLLGEDGSSTSLWDGPADSSGSWRPTAKSDADGRHVAFAVADGDTPTLVVRDLRSDEVHSGALDCDAEAGCTGVVIDGIDGGTVFVRTSEGTFTWDYLAAPDSGLARFAAPGTRVADARAGVVLYDGPPPDVPGDWRLVPGAIDAQLTFDGRHVLYWSATLQPTTPGEERLRLKAPESLVFFAMDTDGSVLAATAGDPARVYDCPLPSGRCVRIGAMPTRSGDPVFMGSDM